MPFTLSLPSVSNLTRFSVKKRPKGFTKTGSIAARSLYAERGIIAATALPHASREPRPAGREPAAAAGSAPQTPYTAAVDKQDCTWVKLSSLNDFASGLIPFFVRSERPLGGNPLELNMAHFLNQQLSFQWLGHPFSEPTDTLVMNVSDWFIDLRILKADGSLLYGCAGEQKVLEVGSDHSK